MKSINNITLILILVLAIASCMPKPRQKPGNEEAAAVKAIPVRTMEIAQSAITRTLEYTANLTAFKEINYAPAAPGRVDQINVEIGDRVKKGEILVETDKTQLSQARTQLASAEDMYQRIKTLYDQGSISEQQYEQTKTQYELAQQNVDFLIENTTLVSPINGIVTGKYFEDGEMFSGAPNTQAGKAAIITLMQINPLKAIVSISQVHYPSVKRGMKVRITSDVLPGEEFDGKISKVYPTINPMTRTFQTEILVQNPKERLRPGMFANMEIFIEEEETMMLPTLAVMKQSGTNNRFLFVHENGKARQINVKIGKRMDDQLEVLSDELSEGMELIIEGQAKLIDGSEIEAVSR